MLALGCLGAAAATPDGAGVESARRLRVDPRLFPVALAYDRLQLPPVSPRHAESHALVTAYASALSGRHAASMTAARRLAAGATRPDVRYQAALLAANVAILTGEYSDGLEHLAVASGLEGSIGEPELVDTGLAVAAMLSLYVDRPARALEFTGKLSARPVSPRLRCAALQIRASALRVSRSESASDSDFASAIEQCRVAGERVVMHLAGVSHARHLAATGRRPEGIRRLGAALQDARQTDNRTLLAEMHGALAELRLAHGDRAGAEAAARRIIAGGVGPGQWKPLVTAHHVLYQAAEARGDHAQALEHYRHFDHAETEYFAAVRARAMAFHLNSAGSITRRRQAELLARQNQSLRLAKSAAEQRAWTSRLVIVGLGVLIAGLAYWGWQYRRTLAALRRQGQVDPLTGLSNRRHFGELAERVVAQARRQGDPVGMLLIDLDHFKQVNDQCGHAAGDCVLRLVATAAQAACREGMLLGRVGGEEFAIALPGSDAEQAARLAEELATAIRSLDVLAGGCFLPVTASIGIASTTQSGYDVEQLMADADRAMYRAKQAGRDRTAFAAAEADDRRQACG